MFYDILIGLFFIYILDYIINKFNNKKESFKNDQTFIPKYLNDPNILLAYKANKIKPNYRPSVVTKISDINDPIFKEEVKKEFNKPSIKPKVTFDPVSTQMNPKYKLYHENNLNFREANGVIINSIKNIDQRVNTNIQDFVNNGIENRSNATEFIPDYNLYNNIISQIPQKEELTNNNLNERTIKEIYDELTNDNRLALQQNLDDLEAKDFRNDYNINEKYGATRFDTYSVNPN
jgi:polyhydroxyalkanoate synthesis regulator phasin